jgi:hypothetical protein
VWRQPYGESRSFWAQGGDSYPGNDSSRDTVTGADRQEHTTDQATIWRWREAFQHDFAARLDWTLKPAGEANHNPVVVVNGRPGSDPIEIEATVGQAVTVDAAGTKDPDGHALRFTWFFYPEAGTGIPDLPVRERRRPSEGVVPGQGGIVSAPAGGPRQPPPRVTIGNATAATATIVPKVAGISHVILQVEDDGTPSLTSYRRVIVRAR